MEFLQDLNEARMIVSKNHLRRMNGRDVADLVFLHFLTLHMLYQEFYTRPWAIEYAKNTVIGGNFSLIRADRTDLHNLLHLILNPNTDVIKHLQDTHESQIFLESLDVDKADIRRYLRLVASNQRNEGFERRFFIKLQRGLHINTSGYSAMRRIITHYNPGNYEYKRLVTTRLLLAFRARAIRSDMYKQLEKFAKTYQLEMKDVVCNPETGKGCDIEQNRNQTQRKNNLTKAALIAAGLAGAYMWGKSQGDKE